MVSLEDCVLSVDVLAIMYDETAGALRLDAAKYVDKAEYENAQAAIYMAEFCETCSDAIALLKTELADIG